MASFDNHSNFAVSTVATAPSPATSGTSLTVQTGDGSKFATNQNCTVWPAGTNPTTANAEIVRITAISTDTFTITRTQESTSARSIQVGDQIANTETKKVFTDIEGLFPSGSVVGTTDTQTLTNKDVSSSTNTFPHFINTGNGTISGTGNIVVSGLDFTPRVIEIVAIAPQGAGTTKNLMTSQGYYDNNSGSPVQWAIYSEVGSGNYGGGVDTSHIVHTSAQTSAQAVGSITSVGSGTFTLNISSYGSVASNFYWKAWP